MGQLGSLFPGWSRSCFGLASQGELKRSTHLPNLSLLPFFLCRDALYLGDCDSGVQKLADLLGWRVELDDLVRRGQEKFKRKPKAHPKAHTKATDKGQGKDEGKGKEEVKGSAGGSKDSQGDGKGKTEEGKPKGKGLIGALTSWL